MILYRILERFTILEKAFLRNLEANGACPSDMHIGSIHFRTAVPIAIALGLLQSAFIFLGPSFVEDRTRMIFLPFCLTLMVGLTLSLVRLSSGNLADAKRISVGILFLACFFAVFFTGGPLKSVATPVLIVLPIIYMCAYSVEGGPHVIVAVPVTCILLAALQKLTGTQLPDFTSQSSAAFNVSAVLVSAYCIVSIAVWALLRTNRNLQTKLEDESKRFAQLSQTDSLTSLANRRVFLEALESALGEPNRTKDVGLIAFDLDHFKEVNDIYGHSTGDKLLKMASSRVMGVIPNGSLLARVGGDEFSLIVFNVNLETLLVLAEKITCALSTEFTIDRQKVLVGASAGAAISSQHGEQRHSLMKAADLALYKAKGEGRQRAVMYQSEMGRMAEERETFELDLHQAVAEDQLLLHFQPIVECGSEQVICWEALIRWWHPTRGLISASDFVAISEKSGSIASLGSWAIREAVSRAAAWTSPVPVSVNLSAVQVKDPEFQAIVEEALESASLDPTQLKFEISGDAISDASEQTMGSLHALQELGVQFTLDDFGESANSLNALRDFTFNRLKIDRNLIAEIGTNPRTEALIVSGISLATKLGIQPIAQGIERQEQIDFVQEHGCNFAQGFWVDERLSENSKRPKYGASTPSHDNSKLLLRSDS